eukprot:RCo033772
MGAGSSARPRPARTPPETSPSPASAPLPQSGYGVAAAPLPTLPKPAAVCVAPVVGGGRKGSGGAPPPPSAVVVPLYDVPVMVGAQRMRETLQGMDVHPQKIQPRGGGVVDLFFAADAVSKMMDIPFFFVTGKRIRVGVPRKAGAPQPQEQSAPESYRSLCIPQRSKPLPDFRGTSFYDRSASRSENGGPASESDIVYLAQLPPDTTGTELQACLRDDLQLQSCENVVVNGPEGASGVSAAVTFSDSKDAARLRQLPFFFFGGCKVCPLRCSHLYVQPKGGDPPPKQPPTFTFGGSSGKPGATRGTFSVPTLSPPVAVPPPPPPPQPLPPPGAAPLDERGAAVGGQD